MDEELQELLKKANSNLELLKKKHDSLSDKQTEYAEKIKALETQNQDLVSQLKALDTKASSDDIEELKNALADLELKALSGNPAVQVDKKALGEAFKVAVGQFIKTGDTKTDFKSFVELKVKAALNLSTTGQGLESVAEVLSREIIERARESYPIISEVRVRNMPRVLREEVVISFPSVQEGIENVAGSSISETDVQRYGEVSNRVAKINAKPRITDEAMVGADLDIYANLLDLLQDEIGRYLAQQILFGDGTGKNMRGILSSNRFDITDGTGESWKPTFGTGARDLDYYAAYSTGVSGGLPATDKAIVDWLIDLTTMLPTKYLNNAKLYMNRRTLAKFKKVRDENDNPIFLPNYRGEQMSILGYPVVIEDYWPDISVDAPFMAFGDLKQAFSISPGDIDKMLPDPYSVDGCTVIKIDKEYFEMVGKNDALIICAATTNEGS